MVALAAAQLEHIVPDVTHPTKWETTASRVYIPIGSPGPAISTNPPELSMEVLAAPNQSWNNYHVAGYHLMQALFPLEMHEQLQNIVNPDQQTLEEWPVHGADYPGVRLQTQRDAVTWFPLPLQNALYNAIYAMDLPEGQRHLGDSSVYPARSHEYGGLGRIRATSPHAPLVPCIRPPDAHGHRPPSRR